MIQDDEDALLCGDDASDTFLCLDQDHGMTPHEGYGVPWPGQADKQELDDTLFMDDETEDSEAINLKQVAQVDLSIFEDSHIGSGFDSDSDHLDLFDDQYLFSGALHEDGAEDQMGITDSEGIDLEEDEQDDDRYNTYITQNPLMY